jgi:lipopolysaccharide biosynthesis glycosyltransferase
MIVHFMGGTKPWHANFGDHHPVRDEMGAYFAVSPWPGFFQKRSFDQEWSASQAAQGLVTTSPSQKLTVLPPLSDVDGLWRYLQETKFADVEAGITRLHLAIDHPVFPSALLPPSP